MRAYLHDGDAPFEIYEVAETDCGPQRFRVRMLAAPPDEIGCVLGDVLHNARSALDHAARDLVEAARGQMGDRTGFPAGPTREVFMQTVNGSMGSASVAVKTAVRGLEVYPGGAGDDLWQLRRLDIRDKHRVLATVAMAHHLVTMTHRIPGLRPLTCCPSCTRRSSAPTPAVHTHVDLRVGVASSATDTWSYFGSSSRAAT